MHWRSLHISDSQQIQCYMLAHTDQGCVADNWASMCVKWRWQPFLTRHVDCWLNAEHAVMVQAHATGAPAHTHAVRHTRCHEPHDTVLLEALQQGPNSFNFAFLVGAVTRLEVPNSKQLPLYPVSVDFTDSQSEALLLLPALSNKHSTSSKGADGAQDKPSRYLASAATLSITISGCASVPTLVWVFSRDENGFNVEDNHLHVQGITEQRLHSRVVVKNSPTACPKLSDDCMVGAHVSLPHAVQGACHPVMIEHLLEDAPPWIQHLQMCVMRVSNMSFGKYRLVSMHACVTAT